MISFDTNDLRDKLNMKVEPGLFAVILGYARLPWPAHRIL